MNDIRTVYLGLATVLFGFAVVITALFSFASGPAAVVTTVPTVTTSTSIVDELIPAVSITAPPPLTQRSAYFVLGTRNKTDSGWVASLSDTDLVFYARAVCTDFDQSLWFWDMYEKRLDRLEDQGWTSEADATALHIVMGDGVTALCIYNQDRLPSELLGD